MLNTTDIGGFSGMKLNTENFIALVSLLQEEGQQATVTAQGGMYEMQLVTSDCDHHSRFRALYTPRTVSDFEFGLIHGMLKKHRIDAYVAHPLGGICEGCDVDGRTRELQLPDYDHLLVVRHEPQKKVERVRVPGVDSNVPEVMSLCGVCKPRYT